jgi:predicted acetyltransferase
MPPEVSYLADANIDDALDEELRGLLTQCFTKPQDVIFQTQRYFKEPYADRWVIRDTSGSLRAHVGVHRKQVETRTAQFRIGGICEVCVHPDFRGQGYVREMLRGIHAWQVSQGLTFSVLFGNPQVYGSSGYREKTNLLYQPEGGGWEGAEPLSALVCPVTETPWPEEPVFLFGPKF